MNIAILGYGKEGQSVKQYFSHDNIQIFNNFTDADLASFDLSNFDLVFRSPSVKPLNPNWTSVTKYFFQHCPCPIIGITGTKGKGTTASLIATILQSLGKTVHLVGNIGLPAIDVLDKIHPTDVVVYELSSFQLWDLNISPTISVVLRIEPDHLNVHKDFDEYVSAKGNIARFQKKSDSCVFFKDNQSSRYVANLSPAKKIPYPLSSKSPQLIKLLHSLNIPGEHNRENAEAALLAAAAFLNVSLNNLIAEHFEALQSAFQQFQGLPHHIEFVRELNGIKYYDDNFSASYPSLEVALNSFPEQNIILIAGGKDRQLDLSPTKRTIFSRANLAKAILIGETKTALANGEDPSKFILCDDLASAVQTAQQVSEQTPNSIVLMSPGAASFDMFNNFYDRGEQFQHLVQELK